MKKLGHYLLTILLVFTVISGIWVSFELSDKETQTGFRFLGALCTFGLTSFLGISQIRSLKEEYRHSLFGDYLHFLSDFLPFKGLEKSTKEVVDDNLTWLKTVTLTYCEDEIDKIKFLNLVNISKRDIEVKDYSNRRNTEWETFKNKSPLLELENLINEKKHRRIYVLGEAGTGKSHLTKQYVVKLLKDESVDQKIPLYLPAASWEESNNFVGWIISTFEKMHDIPKSIIEGVINNYKERVILVIDGLDEIQEGQRQSFVKELNKYSAENRILVSCRFTDYNSLKGNMKVRADMALRLKALDPKQISEIIKSNSPDKFSEIKRKGISEYLKTPLLLGLYIYTLTLGDEVDFESEENKKPEDKLWQEYINIFYALKKDGIVQPKNQVGEIESEGKYNDAPSNFKFEFDQKSLQKYGANLASKITTTHFTLSSIQPSSISDRYGKVTYVLITQVVLGLITSIGLGLVMGGPLEFLTGGLLGGILSAIFFMVTHFKSVFKFHGNETISNSKANSAKDNVKKMAHLLCYFLFLMFGFTFYFCLSGKRSDMHDFFQYSDLLAVGDFPIALTFSAIFTLILGFHQIRHNLDNDIRLIDSKKMISGNLGYGVLHGLLFSIILAPIVGIIAKIYIVVFPTNIFSEWMVKTLAVWDYGLGQFAIMVVFPIAFLLGFVIGLNNRTTKKFTDSNEMAKDKEDEDWETQQKNELKPYYSIQRTVKATLLFWLIYSVIGAFIWGGVCNFLFQNGWDSINRGVESALGGGIFVGLYWGGKDLIKLWTLRLIMYMRNEMPLQHSKLLYELKMAGILKNQGALFSYSHATLKEFLKSKSVKSSQEKNTFRKKNIARTTIIAISILTLVYFTVNSKIKGRHARFWMEEIQLNLEYQDENFETISSNSLKCNKPGMILVESSGKISAGRILGHITSVGTEIGFFAIPLGDGFDKETREPFRHGELLYSKNKTAKWKSVFPKSEVPAFSNFRFSLCFKDSIQVQKGDVLEFDINDKEPENNSGEFQIKLRYQ
ncbi:MAG: hypothetical protein ACI9RM_000895 [Ulvibacter sp.]|jgi:hypothetical protein